MRDEVIATLQPYLDGGWSFVAMRLTSAAPLNGALDPVRLTFASDHQVYPMRMSSAATYDQKVTVYVLGPHRVVRNDPDSRAASSYNPFAGRIDPVDADLKQLSADGNNFLTAETYRIWDPSRITSDFTFAAASDDEEYRAEEHRVEYVQFLGIPAGFAILIGIVLFGPALGILIIAGRLARRVRRA